MNSKCITLIFGAGATRGALQNSSVPPPIDKDFFDIAGQIRGRGTPRLAKQVIRDVFDLYGCFSGIGLEQYFRDIETRAEVSSFAKTKNKPKDWKRRQLNLEELIRRVLLQTTCDFTNNPATCKKSPLHTKILRHLRPKDTVITFNYDTLIEESFPNELSWNPRSGYGMNTHGIIDKRISNVLLEAQG